MQTFLPYPTFRASARCLDPLRLGKQRTEAVQILETIYEVEWDPNIGQYFPRMVAPAYRNHPAVRMWRGYTDALAVYADAVIHEHVARGGSDNLRPRLSFFYDDAPEAAVPPPWLGDERFHSAHRAILLAKEPSWYQTFGWTESPATRDPATGRWPYLWPES